jgi:hypothetical protein
MAGKWQVSAKGGEAPHWQRDGKALYYLAAGRTLMKVDFVAAGGAFEIKAQHAVANVAVAPLPFKRSFAYDVMPDGKRILVNGRTEDPESLTVISNWMAALNK